MKQSRKKSRLWIILPVVVAVVIIALVLAYPSLHYRRILMSSRWDTDFSTSVSKALTRDMKEEYRGVRSIRYVERIPGTLIAWCVVSPDMSQEELDQLCSDLEQGMSEREFVTSWVEESNCASDNPANEFGDMCICVYEGNGYSSSFLLSSRSSFLSYASVVEPVELNEACERYVNQTWLRDTEDNVLNW